MNAKALHELILYYLRERMEHGNTDLKYLVITDIHQWYVFEAGDFDKLFYQNRVLRKEYEAWRDGRKTQSTTDFFYRDIAQPFVEAMDDELPCVAFDLRDYEKALDKGPEQKLLPLFKLLSPTHLLRLPFANDSNSLDKTFYHELLHIIGLTESKEKNKKVIQRKPEGERNHGSLLENAITTLQTEDRLHKVPKPSQYGSNKEERLFNVGLELAITWVNRILFLKLLEAQLLQYHENDPAYRFLNSQTITDFDELNELFFEVLAKQKAERPDYVQQKYAHVPYLNSSLFEISELEDATLRINSLKDRFTLPILPKTVLKDPQGKRRNGEAKVLNYFFDFLDAYDFSSEGSEDIQEENKTLINASVLGLIFEKINGYRDGSFFTPGFITMYMCRETLRRAVVQKFEASDAFPDYEGDSFEGLIHYMDRHYKPTDKEQGNKLINDLKVCDPAVGSGHFLVSALNELITIKSELGLLLGRDGKPLPVRVEVENDELMVSWRHSDELFEYRPGVTESQRVQEALFHEKQTLIENCLFGVDINPNSVKICRLRLWIELLKNAYYKNDPTSELETLPNIDINIKQGNSLVSRFDLEEDLSPVLRKSKWKMSDYRIAVSSYQHATSKKEKQKLLQLIDGIKGDFQTHIYNRDPRIKRLSKLRGQRSLIENKSEIGDLFEKLKEQDVAEDLNKVNAKIEKLEMEIEDIRNAAIYENAFEWRFEFPEVLDEDGNYQGFDVVVGNPPYGIKFTKEEKSYLKKEFISIVGKYESYGFFIEKGIKLLTKSGGLGFIVPHTWLTIKEAASLREYILSSTKIIEFNKLPSRVFDDAVVEAINVFLKRSTSKKDRFNSVIKVLVFPNEDIEHIIGSKARKIHYHQKDWESSNTFNIYVTPKEQVLLNKLATTCPKLSEYCELSVGIQAYDSYTGQKKEIIKQRAYHSEIKENETYVKELNGKEVGRYYYQWRGNSWVSYGEWLAHPRQVKFFKQDRILVREIIGSGKNKIMASYVTGFIVNYKTILNIILKRHHSDSAVSLFFLLGIVNSTLISWVFDKSSNKLVTQTFPRISLFDLKKLPISTQNNSICKKISDYAEEISIKKQQDPTADTTALEAKIDLLVYHLYGLSWAEVKLVDPEFGMGEEEYEAVEV